MAYTKSIETLIAALDAAYIAAGKAWHEYAASDDDKALQDEFFRCQAAYKAARKPIANYPAETVEDFAIMCAALLEIPPTDLEGNDFDDPIFNDAEENRAIWKASQKVMGNVLPVSDFSLGPRMAAKVDMFEDMKGLIE